MGGTHGTRGPGDGGLAKRSSGPRPESRACMPRARSAPGVPSFSPLLPAPEPRLSDVEEARHGATVDISAPVV